MAKKFYEVALLADETARRITSSAKEWTSYLKTAGRLYRYSFQDQMLIYAQRPDATACATISVWNDFMNCWVNKGAKGIALIDRNSPYRNKLRYVFDVSDVHKSRYNGILPYRWEVREEHKEAIINRLEDTYGGTDPHRPFEERLIELSGHIAEETVHDQLHDLMAVKEDSFLSGLDEQNTEIRFRETLTASVAYTLLSRCGADADDYIGDFHFDYIKDFSSSDVLSILGEAVSSICDPILHEICLVVGALEKQQTKEIQKNNEKGLENSPNLHYNALKRESEAQEEPYNTETGNAVNETDRVIKEKGGNDHGADLQERRGLSGTGADIHRGSRGNTDEVRNAAGDISGETSQGNLYRQGAERRAESTLSGDTEAGRGEGREDHQPDDGERGRERGTERERPDGMGTQDELDQQPGGRDRPERDRLQHLDTGLDSDTKAEIKYEQLSLFPSMEEQVGKITVAEAEKKIKAPATFVLSDEEISDILRTGSGRRNSRQRIYERFLEERTPEYMADFLKQEYGTSGKGFEINGSQISVWSSGDGMSFGYGKSALESPFLILSWSEVQGRVSEMVETGEFLTHNEAFAADHVYREELASKIYFFFRDTLGEQPESFELKAANFQDTQKRLAELLDKEESRNILRDEILSNVKALEQGEKSIKWRLNTTPQMLADLVTGYAGVKRELPAKDTLNVMKESFVTQDEIDHILCRGSVVEHSKYRVYDFFRENHERKEQAAFLRNEYGTGGTSAPIWDSDKVDEMYDSKGIRITKGNLLEPEARIVLNWNVVAKRLEQLIFEDRFLKPEEKEKHDQLALEAAQA